MTRTEYELIVTYPQHELEESLLERLLPLRPRGFYGITGVAECELHAFFDGPLSKARVRNLLRGIAAPVHLHVRRVPPRAWEQDWLCVWQPIRIGRFLVKPPALRTRSRNSIVLEIEPGQAFGTGLHETTQLMLRFLDGMDVRGCDVLDIGTGTGILSIAAARLGARRVLALDKDPTAVAEAHANVVRNRVDGRVEVVCGTFHALPRQTFDVVLANLDLKTLIGRGKQMLAALNDHGIWLASGLLVDQARAFEGWLRKRRLRRFRKRRQGVWLAYRIRA